MAHVYIYMSHRKEVIYVFNALWYNAEKKRRKRNIENRLFVQVLV